MPIQNTGDGFIASRVSKVPAAKAIIPKQKDQMPLVVSAPEAAASFDGRVDTVTPKLEPQLQRVNVFTQLSIADGASEHAIVESDTEPSRIELESEFEQLDVRFKKSPELAALEKIAPGWSERILMIDPAKEPDVNRLVYDQLVKDLDDAVKDRKIDEDTGRVLVASLLTKISELEEADIKNQYGVKQEQEQDVKVIAMHQEYSMMRLQMLLDFIRDCFTWYDPETGEKHEPTGSNSQLEHLRKMHDLSLSQARTNNEAIKKQNDNNLAQARLLDKTIEFQKFNRADVTKVKSATIQDANRIYLMRETADIARLIEQGQKPEIKDRLIKSLTKKYQEVMPEQKVTEVMVTDFVMSRMKV